MSYAFDASHTSAAAAAAASPPLLDALLEDTPRRVAEPVMAMPPAFTMGAFDPTTMGGAMSTPFSSATLFRPQPVYRDMLPTTPLTAASYTSDQPPVYRGVQPMPDDDMLERSIMTESYHHSASKFGDGPLPSAYSSSTHSTQMPFLPSHLMTGAVATLLQSAQGQFFQQSTTTTAAPRPVLAQPPQCPQHLSMNAYPIAAALAVVQEIILTFCTQMKADCEFRADQFAYHCVYYSHQAETKFRINVYEKAAGQHVVELQRVSSDGGFGFVDVIRGAKCYFQQYGQGTGGVAGAGKPSKPLADWRKTSAGLAPPPVCRVAPDVVPQTVKNILHMASSTHSDVQSEALTVLADMSTQEDVQEAIISSGTGLPLLIGLLDSRVPTVHRCAAATLANIVEAGRGVGARALPQVFEANGIAAIQKLLLTSSTPQVLRECGKALSEMCMMDKGRVLKSLDKRCMTKLSSHFDQSIACYATSFEFTIGTYAEIEIDR